jgi:hypothetical protein
MQSRGVSWSETPPPATDGHFCTSLIGYLFYFLEVQKNQEHSYILLNARKGVYRALTAWMSYVLALESLLVWHWPRYTDRSLYHYSGSL